MKNLKSFAAAVAMLGVSVFQTTKPATAFEMMEYYGQEVFATRVYGKLTPVMNYKGDAITPNYISGSKADPYTAKETKPNTVTLTSDGIACDWVLIKPNNPKLHRQNCRSALTGQPISDATMRSQY